MKTATAKKVSVSIVVPAFNEERAIGDCLTSIANQKYQSTEVILIDDFSTDKTGLLAVQIAKELKINLKVIKNKQHRERGYSRNLGAKTAKGQYLLFIDADMKLDKGVVSECIQIVSESPNVGAIIIPEESYGEGFWSNCRRLEKRCYLGDDRIEAARFINKKIFWEVGGWNSKMISGEDWDLTRRIRSSYEVERIKSFIYHNEYHLTLWKAMKKKYYYASVSGIYLEKNPITIFTVIFFIFRPSFVKNWRLLLSNPIYGVGMVILKIMELLAGSGGYLFSKLPSRS